MELESFRIIIALVEEGSTLGASRVLPCSRSTVRRRLEALEASLGTPLFERRPDGLAPTPAGAFLARRSREVLAGVEALARTVREMGGAPRRRIRCRVPPGLPPTAIVHFQRLLCQMFPGLRIETRVGRGSVEELLREVDFAIQIGDPPSGPFESIPVGQGRVRLLASPDYLAAHPPIQTPEDVLEHDVLAWVCPGEDAPDRLPRSDAPDLPLEPMAVCEDIFWVRQMAIHGLGLGLVLDGFAEPLEPEGALVPVLPKIVGVDRTIWFVVSEAARDAPAMQGLIAVARAAYDIGGMSSAA